MKYLKISNSIEIETNAFLLLGACTKRDDESKIGYFGSGLKYALTVFLREGIELNIWSGLKPISLSTVTEQFRGEEFRVLTIADQKTNLTTEMGIDWKLWQAVREVYCNALDEEEFNSEVVEEIVPIEGQTQFYITITGNEQIEAILNNWDRYFARDRKIHAGCDTGTVMFPLETNISVYRKGIRCYDEPSPSLFDYDLKHIDITESRLIRYSFQLREAMARIWGESATETMIDKLVTACSGDTIKTVLEYNISWRHAKVFNPTWLKYFTGKTVLPLEMAGHYSELVGKPNTAIIPITLLQCLINYFGDDIKTPFLKGDLYANFLISKKTTRDEFLLKEAMQFFQEIGIRIDHPIEIAVFEDKNILGHTTGETIYLSPRVMDLGKKKIVTTIMEECFHLESQMRDETRGFQDYLINQMVTMLENAHGIFL